MMKLRKQQFFKFTINLLVCFLYSLNLYAITPADTGISNFNPFSVEPGQIGKTLYRNAPGVTTETAPIQAPQQPEAAAMQKQLAEAAKISFVLNGIRFTGNHVYSSQELLQLFTPYLHKKITVAKLMELVQSVSLKYQKAGYFLSKALLPQQQIKNGVVTVQIVEGFISFVDIQGIKDKRTQNFLLKYGAAIESIKPIKLDRLERYLLLLNDLNGFQVKSLIAPDPKTPLGSKLTLVTQLTPVFATVTRDNYQTRYLGPLEHSAYGSINSTILPGGSLYMRALASVPTTKLQYYEMRHTQPLGTDGLIWGIDGYYTQTNPQFILTPLEVFGFSGDGNTFFSYPILRSRERTLRFQSQFDYMNSHSNVLGQQLYKDRNRDFTFSLQYDDVLWKGQDSIYGAVDKGFNILGASDEGFRSRTGASADFFKLNTTMTRTQFLSERFSLYALLTAQWANRVLLSSEAFTFGGPFLGRGYDMSQFTSDEAVAGTLEFRINTAPNLPFAKQVQYYVFYDAGKFWNNSELLSLANQGSAASVGFGARAAIMPHFNAEGFVGRPMTTPNATQIILGRNGHAFLGYFQLSVFL